MPLEKELDIFIEYDSGIPVYRQIIDKIKFLISSGILKAGVQLPPIVALAKKLRVNANTVYKAYRELEHLGIVKSFRGSGTFIREMTVVSNEDKNELIRELYNRTISAGADYGLTEKEITDYFIERSKSCSLKPAEE